MFERLPATLRLSISAPEANWKSLPSMRLRRHLHLQVRADKFLFSDWNVRCPARPLTSGQTADWTEKLQTLFIGCCRCRTGSRSARPNGGYFLSKAVTTCCGSILIRQRKSIGHTRRKQGEQGASDRRIACLESEGSPGAVR